jgi:hypothetical protein
MVGDLKSCIHLITSRGFVVELSGSARTEAHLVKRRGEPRAECLAQPTTVCCVVERIALAA